MTKSFSKSYKNYYAQMWQYEQNTEVIINSIDVFEPITNMSNGIEEGFEFINGYQLRVIKSGLYKVNWNICFNNSNNTIWEAGILINDIIQDNTIGCRKLGAIDTGSMGGTGIIRVEKDDIIEIGMANETNTSNAFVDSANMSIMRLDR